MQTDYQICTQCIMDNISDPYISFDEKGQCNYCKAALQRLPLTYFPNLEGKRKLNDLVVKLKQEGKGKKYDCLMGISGGLDSAYLAYLGAIKWGLRISFRFSRNFINGVTDARWSSLYCFQ